MHSQVRFKRVLENSGEGLGGFGAESGQVQEGSEGLGSLGAGPGQVQQRSGEVLREVSGRLWCRARSSSTGFRRMFRRMSGRLWCSQVKFNRAGEGSRRRLGALVQSQVRFKRVPEKVAEKVPEKVSGIFGAGPGQVQRVLEKFVSLLYVFLASQYASERFVICKNKALRLLGMPPKLIFSELFLTRAGARQHGC